MIDSEVRETPEQTRFKQADDAYNVLIDQIGGLSETEITEENAPFIAGLLLSRSIEAHFLDTQAVRATVDNPADPYYRNLDIKDKKITAKDHKILIEATRGNFSKLKNFVKNKAEEYKDWAQDYEEGDLEYQRLFRSGNNMALISDKIPLRGNGSAIRIPNPAHTEESVPLRIQLQMLKQGGESTK